MIIWLYIIIKWLFFISKTLFLIIFLNIIKINTYKINIPSKTLIYNYRCDLWLYNESPVVIRWWLSVYWFVIPSVAWCNNLCASGDRLAVLMCVCCVVNYINTNKTCQEYLLFCFYFPKKHRNTSVA